MRDQLDEILFKAAAQAPLEVPESLGKRIEDTLAVLPRHPEKRRIRLLPRMAAVAASLVFAFLVLIPNLSPAYAAALERVPVLGDIVRVVTVRNYLYTDPTHELDIKVPQLQGPQGASGMDAINADVAELTGQLMEQFYSEVGPIGSEGHSSMLVDYTVVTNTERWFTLKLSIHILEGSGGSTYRYYNLDKATGETAALGDILEPDAVDLLAGMLRQQMNSRAEADESQIYWVDDEEKFVRSLEAHNFYFDENGSLRIPFDKYEISPGCMGSPEFTIPREEIRPLLREQYRDLCAVG